MKYNVSTSASLGATNDTYFEEYPNINLIFDFLGSTCGTRSSGWEPLNLRAYLWITTYCEG